MDLIMKHIAFAKIGKSVKLRTNKYSPVGGDNEASCVLRAIANNNPDKIFYIVGRSDFASLTETDKADLFPYNNVIDIWAEMKIERVPTDRYFWWIKTYFEENNITLDATVMMVGQICNVSIPEKMKKVREENDDGKPAFVLDMTKWYVTPLTFWLNECKPHYVEVINDPRYTMRQARDFMHLPFKGLSQYDYTYTAHPIKSIEDQSRQDIPVDCEYAAMETAFCVDYEYTEEVNTNRNTDFMVVLNEGKPSRYKLLKEWVLDKFDDVEIYGKWGNNAEGDERFKGSMHLKQLQNKLQDVKFTFIIPIKEGWVTSKYIEMIHAGVIPFLHPSYDMQGHTPIPEILRPKTPEEFHKNLQYLIDNKLAYEQTITELRKAVLKPEYYDGSFINDKIFTAFDSNYKRPDLSGYEVQKPATLEAFF
jgi:hypothetical protein